MSRESLATQEILVVRRHLYFPWSQQDREILEYPEILVIPACQLILAIPVDQLSLRDPQNLEFLVVQGCLVYLVFLRVPGCLEFR